MTPDEELAVKVVEARLRGMHPEWVRWFTYYQRGRYFDTISRLNEADLQQIYGHPPTEIDKDGMRIHTEGQYEP